MNSVFAAFVNLLKIVNGYVNSLSLKRLTVTRWDAELFRLSARRCQIVSAHVALTTLFRTKEKHDSDIAYGARTLSGCMDVFSFFFFLSDRSHGMIVISRWRIFCFPLYYSRT